MDEVQELIAQLRRAVKEHSGWEPSASVLERAANDAADQLERLTKALTVSPEKLAGLVKRFEEMGSSAEYGFDGGPDDWAPYARAAAIALGLVVKD